MITVRELTPDDNLDEVLRLCREFFAEYENHHEEFFDTDNLTDDDISDRFIKSMSTDNSATIIALENDNIVGITNKPSKTRRSTFLLLVILFINLNPLYKKLVR